MNKQSNSSKGFTIFFVVLLVLSVLSGISSLGSSDSRSRSSSSSERCALSGCNNYKAYGSIFCYSHKVKSSSSTGSGSSSYSGTSGASHSSGSYQYNSSNSYDDGYNDVYEEDDYDWDRYWEDSEYAEGVDDALEDEEDD